MITPVQLAHEVRKLADERPDFVYDEDGSGCSYVYDSVNSEVGEGCIVGQALQALGVPCIALKMVDDATVDAAHLFLDPRLSEWLHSGVSKKSAEMLVAENLRGVPRGTERWDDKEIPSVMAMYWLNEVQSHQDTGTCWGNAVRKADERIPEVQSYEAPKATTKVDEALRKILEGA